MALTLCKGQEVDVEHKAFVHRLSFSSGEQNIPHPVACPDIIHRLSVIPRVDGGRRIKTQAKTLNLNSISKQASFPARLHRKKGARAAQCMHA